MIDNDKIKKNEKNERNKRQINKENKEQLLHERNLRMMLTAHT